jgi:hypothetical protein
MRKSFPFVLTLVALACLLASSTLKNTGSPGAKTGSPLDGATCAQCHNSTVSTVSWISSTIPETGYNPGTKYTITLNANEAGTAKVGFELTAESTVGKQGTFTITDDGRTKLTNSNKAVTHKLEGINPVDGKITWSVDWTAPVKGTGDVSFYAAINAANGNGSTSGDKIYTSKLSVKEATQTIVERKNTGNVSVYPNPAYGFFFVESQEAINEVSVYDLSGKAVAITKNVNSSKTQINLENYNQGIFVVKTITAKGETTTKLQVY